MRACARVWDCPGCRSKADRRRSKAASGPRLGPQGLRTLQRGGAPGASVCARVCVCVKEKFRRRGSYRSRHRGQPAGHRVE